jgi:hypothetical protein
VTVSMAAAAAPSSTPAAGTAVSGATTMQQGPEPSFNVSVDYGRFAPLMGAPSTLNMTPGARSASGVTGPEFSFPDMSQVSVALHWFCCKCRKPCDTALTVICIWRDWACWHGEDELH